MEQLNVMERVILLYESIGLSLFIDKYKFVKQTPSPYRGRRKIPVPSTLRSFDVVVSISTKACQTYAFTDIGYRILARAHRL